MLARIGTVLCALSLLATSGLSQPLRGVSPDIAQACGDREGWSDPAPPAHIHGRSFYVGTCGVTVVLVETPAGLVLIDSGPKEATAHVLANLRRLGFEPRQVKWILSTHEHFDHGGGIAALMKATGAQLAVGPRAAAALRSGKPFPDDPQLELLAKDPMAPARVDRVLADGTALSVGGIAFTAHATPTHSPGSTSWTWPSCEKDKCLTIAYADSVSTISADSYRFTHHPQRVEAARQGLQVIESLPCDLMLTPHPSASDLLRRLSGKAALIDASACATYARSGRKNLAERLEKEQAKP